MSNLLSEDSDNEDADESKDLTSVYLCVMPSLQKTITFPARDDDVPNSDWNESEVFSKKGN